MRIVLGLLAGLIALATGAQVFIAIIYAPVVIFGDYEILMVWMWVAPFLGLAIGAPAAWFIYRLMYIFLANAASARSLGWLKVLAVFSISFAGSLWLTQVMRKQGDVRVVWSEEVRLNDGSLVSVSREVIGNTLGLSKHLPEDWSPSEFVINTASIPALSGAPAWRASLRPLVLDKDALTNTWFLLAEPISCAQWQRMGQPESSYFVFVYRVADWVRESSDPKYIGMSANLLNEPRFKWEVPVVLADEAKRRNESRQRTDGLVIRAENGCTKLPPGR